MSEERVLRRASVVVGMRKRLPGYRFQLLTETRFAVGVVQQTNRSETVFQLFRSYSLQGFGRQVLLPGPNAASCQILEVFAASGAAKLFLQPYKVGNPVFFDDVFPQSHPITLMALEEAFGIYASDVPISVLLNIGPGMPSERDRQQLEYMSIGSIVGQEILLEGFP